MRSRNKGYMPLPKPSLELWRPLGSLVKSDVGDGWSRHVTWRSGPALRGASATPITMYAVVPVAIFSRKDRINIWECYAV